MRRGIKDLPEFPRRTRTMGVDIQQTLTLEYNGSNRLFMVVHLANNCSTGNRTLGYPQTHTGLMNMEPQGSRDAYSLQEVYKLHV